MYMIEEKVPIRLKPRWAEGIFLGLVQRSNDIYVGIPKRHVIEARSFKRMPDSQNQKAAAVWKSLRGVPWDPKPADGVKPRVSIDTTADTPAAALPPVFRKAIMGRLPRRVFIRKAELEKYTYSANCQGCVAAQLGVASSSPFRGLVRTH